MEAMVAAYVAAGITGVLALGGLIYWIGWKKQQSQLLEVLQQILVAANNREGGDGSVKNKEILEKFRDALISIEKKVSNPKIGGGGGAADMASSTKMAKMLEGIRDYLADGKAHQVRLQEGYDYAVLKNFCKQIIRCIHRAEQADKETLKETLDGIRTDLLDLLERNGVERFEPAKGQAFSKLRKVARVLPQKETTQDDALVGTVAEVVSPGYLYTYNDDKQRLILPAEVKIYEKPKE